MAKVRLRQWLHCDSESFFETLLSSDNLMALEGAGISLSTEDEIDEFCQEIHNPFYEVTFEYELDTDTNQITIISHDARG